MDWETIFKYSAMTSFRPKGFGILGFETTEDHLFVNFKGYETEVVKVCFNKDLEIVKEKSVIVKEEGDEVEGEK